MLKHHNCRVFNFFAYSESVWNAIKRSHASPCTPSFPQPVGQMIAGTLNVLIQLKKQYFLIFQLFYYIDKTFNICYTMYVMSVTQNF